MSRKYRQRGYREEEGDERRDGRTSGRGGPDSDRPKGRGLGRPGREAFRCAACGRESDPPAPEERDAVCDGCGGPLHTCTNCRHFDTGARLQCRRPIEEPIRAKAKANECSLFEAKISLSHEKGAAKGPDGGRAAFDALFGDL